MRLIYLSDRLATHLPCTLLVQYYFKKDLKKHCHELELYYLCTNNEQLALTSKKTLI